MQADPSLHRPEQRFDPKGEIVCPICGGTTKHFVTKRAQERDWHVQKCLRCGHGFVKNRPSKDFLRRYYSSSLNSHSHSATSPGPAEASAAWTPVVETLRRAGAPRSGATLDVGASYGGLAYALAQEGYEPVLLDLSPEVVNLAKTIPNASGACCSFEDFAWPSPFSIITMSQVLEHANDPIAWLKHARKLIQPNGVLMVAVPNFGGVYRLLGRRDPFICPPEHLSFFTVSSLKKAIETGGFSVCQVRTDSRVVLSHHAKQYTFLRAVAGRVWNIGSRVLDCTSYGIITTVCAVPS